MANGIRTGEPRGFNKGRSSKFREGSRVRQTPEEGRRTYRPKRCGNNNKDEDNSPKNLNDKNFISLFQVTSSAPSSCSYLCLLHALELSSFGISLLSPSIIPLLFFYKDGNGIKKPKKVVMPLNKNQTETLKIIMSSNHTSCSVVGSLWQIYLNFCKWLKISSDLPRVRQWSERPAFNPRSRHTKDFKNGTWYLLA